MRTDSMKNLKILFLLFLVAVLGSCASGNKVTQSSRTELNKKDAKKAYDYYLEGALLDFQDEYEKALIEYYQAMLYDSGSAQIYKAIARDLMRLQRYENAIEYLKKSYRKNSRDKETLNYLGEAYYNNKDFDESLFYYEKLFALDPYNPTVQNNLIYLYSNLKKEKKLLDFYRKLADLYPGEPRYVVQYAMALIRQRKLDEAQAVLEHLAGQDSAGTRIIGSGLEKSYMQESGEDYSDLNVLYILGTLHEMKKDTAAAINIYQKILKQDPQFEDALSHLYRIYRARQNWQGIEDTYLPLVKADSTNWQARLILSESLFFQEKFNDARKMLKPVLDQPDYRPAALELLGRIAFEKEQYDEAEKYFRSLTEENPDNRFGWIFLTVLYNRQEQYNKSIETLQDALSRHSDDPDLLGMYGATLSEMGRDRDALEPLKKALELNPDDPGNIASLAATYDKLQMWTKSDSLYEKYIGIFPENALLLNNYSYSLTERDVQLEKALDLAQKAIKIDPKNAAYLDTIGWIYFKMGNYHKALDYIKEAVADREESVEVIDHLAEVYYKLGQKDEARKYWEKALEKDPGNSEIRKKIQNL